MLPSPKLSILSILILWLSSFQLYAESDCVAAEKESNAQGVVSYNYIVTAVALNEKEVSEGVTALSRQPCNDIYLLAEDLLAWRVNVSPYPVVLIDGEMFLSLSALDGVTYRYDQQKGVTHIKVEPLAFVRTVIDFNNVYAPAVDDVMTSGFINYSFSTREFDSLFATVELGLSSPIGVLTSRWFKDITAEDSRIIRSETSFVYDFLEHESRLVLGDISQQFRQFNVPGGQLSGISYSTETSIHPREHRGVVDNFEVINLEETLISMRENLRYLLASNSQSTSYADRPFITGGEEFIPVGPVSIRNYPVRRNSRYSIDGYLSGEKHSLGRGYHYYPGSIIKKGTWRYSFAAGSPRQAADGDPHYSGLEINASVRYGALQGTTLRGGVSSGKRATALGAGFQVGIPRVGVLDVGYLYVHNRSTDNSLRDNYQARISIHNIFPRLNYGLSAEYLTGDVVSPSDHTHRFIAGGKVNVTESIGYRPQSGSYGVSISNSNQWQGGEEISGRVALVISGNFFDNVPINFTWTHRYHPTHENNWFLSWSVPFGRGLGRRFDSNGGRGAFRSLTENLTLRSQHRLADDYSYSGSSIVQSRATSENKIHNTSLYYQQDHSEVNDNNFNVHYTNQWFSANFNVRDVFRSQANSASLSGAAVITGSGIFLTRNITSGYGLVRLGEGGAGLVVNGYRANNSGNVLIPSLTPYAENLVQISRAEIPTNAVIDRDYGVIVPRFRTGVMVELPVRLVRTALVQILLEFNGELQPLPYSAEVTSLISDEYIPVDDDSIAYLESEEEQLDLLIRLKGQSCITRVILPKPIKGLDEDIPEIAPVSCKLH